MRCDRYVAAAVVRCAPGDYPWPIADNLCVLERGHDGDHVPQHEADRAREWLTAFADPKWGNTPEAATALRLIEAA